MIRPSRIAFLAALAIPRIVRMAHPQIWIEDESYLNCAYLLATGQRPYVDFPLPHLPALEALLALAFSVLPASIRTAEALTQAAALAGSILVFAVGLRLSDRAHAGTAAVIFATSPLLFRYHIFEREVFLVLPVLAATWLALRTSATHPRGVRDAIVLGVLLAVALSIKLTAVSYVGSFVLFFALVRRDRRSALVLLATAAALVAVEIGALRLAFGSSVLTQVVVFRLVHSSFPSSLLQLSEFRNSLDVALALGAVGVAVAATARRLRDWALPALHLASAFVLLVLLNPSFWPHDGIELLPWLALFGSGVVVGTVRAMRRILSRVRRSRRERLADRRAVAAFIVSVLLLVWVVPFGHPDWPGGFAGRLGFGYRDRREIARAAAYLRERTNPSDLVATPPIIAFAANRAELVPYPELAGTMMALEQEIDSRGLVAAVRSSRLRGRLFWEEVSSSSELWLPAVRRAIADGRVAAVINFSEDDLFPVPLIDVPDGTLSRFGYEAGLSTGHYTVWVAPGRR